MNVLWMTTQLNGITQSHLSTNQNEEMIHKTKIYVKYQFSDISIIKHVYHKTLTP